MKKLSILAQVFHHDFHKKLSPSEQRLIIFVHDKSRRENIMKLDTYCRISLKEFSFYLDMSTRHIQRIIKKLKSMDLLEVSREHNRAFNRYYVANEVLDLMLGHTIFDNIYNRSPPYSKKPKIKLSSPKSSTGSQTRREYSNVASKISPRTPRGKDEDSVTSKSFIPCLFGGKTHDVASKLAAPPYAGAEYITNININSSIYNTNNTLNSYVYNPELSGICENVYKSKKSGFYVSEKLENYGLDKQAMKLISTLPEVLVQRSIESYEFSKKHIEASGRRVYNPSSLFTSTIKNESKKLGISL